MSLNNREEIIKINEGDFQKEYEKLSTIDIDSKLNAIQATMRTDDLGFPLLTGTEITALKKKLHNLQRILVAIKTKKLAEQTQQREKQDAQYSEQAAKRHVHADKNVRICYDPITTSMRVVGTDKITFDAIQLITPTSTEIDIPCESKRIRKIDLTKIPAKYWRMMEEHKFAPLYFTIESSGMLNRKGDILPYWSNQAEYSAVLGQKQIGATVLLLMLV